MAIPALASVTPSSGPTSGGDILRLSGTGFAARVAVRLGGLRAEVLSIREEAGTAHVDVRTPPNAVALVDVELHNLSADGRPVPGEAAALPGAYRYLRPRVAKEAALTRLVRTLLRELKRQVVANVSASVSVDYDDTVADGLNVIAMASLPSVVLSGPTLRESRRYSTNVLHEDVVQGPSGAELVRRRPAYTVDLAFTLTVASARTAELFNLMAAVATFLNRNRWLSMPRDAEDASLGTVRWEMDADGEARAQLGSRDDVRAFTWGFLVRGFDVDEGLPFDLGKAVSEAQLEADSLSGGTS
ncbi:IPT/TIG domain-containing protein [Corallococcus macrosporus]|uniref:Transcription factor n=1 Tax=Corallococcus macrosporus DSM 14697 TaxID=1189310 RepID=A0A250JQ17_9BACT|nr:IPT/TIG domain-containing protein [Corallococcus macrosporus]ATB45959.1 transcription factor [Corallococcus macrosporus DSM 14697]